MILHSSTNPSPGVPFLCRSIVFILHLNLLIPKERMCYGSRLSSGLDAIMSVDNRRVSTDEDHLYQKNLHHESMDDHALHVITDRTRSFHRMLSSSKEDGGGTSNGVLVLCNSRGGLFQRGCDSHGISSEKYGKDLWFEARRLINGRKLRYTNEDVPIFSSHAASVSSSEPIHYDNGYHHHHHHHRRRHPQQQQQSSNVKDSTDDIDASGTHDTIDRRYGVEKRLVPTGPNPLHN